MSTTYRRRRRFLPTISQVLDAAKNLPEATENPDKTVQVQYTDGNREHTLVYRSVKCSTPGGLEFRWIYDGKLLIG